MLGFKVIHEAMTFVTAQSAAYFIRCKDSSRKGLHICMPEYSYTVNHRTLYVYILQRQLNNTWAFLHARGTKQSEELLSENGFNLKLVAVKSDSSTASQQGGLCIPRTDNLCLALTAQIIQIVEVTVWQMTICFPMTFCTGIHLSS